MTAWSKDKFTWALVVPHSEMLDEEVIKVEDFHKWAEKGVGDAQQEHVLSQAAFLEHIILVFKEPVDQNRNYNCVD